MPPAASATGSRTGVRRRSPDNYPDLDRFKGDFSHSPTTVEFRAKFEAGPEWQKHRARTKGRSEQGQEYKGQLIGEVGEGDVAKIGDVRLFERNGETYARGIDGIERKVGRKPKEGKGQPVKNSRHLERDVIYEDAGDGGHLVTIIVRDNSRKGKEVFNGTVYYNRYGLPEFEAKETFWIPPEKLSLTEGRQRSWVWDKIREVANDENRWTELELIGISRKKIAKFRGSGNSDDLGIVVHHDYQLGRMLIVDAETHRRFYHEGGGSAWGKFGKQIGRK